MVSNKNNLKRGNSIGQIFTPDYVAEFMVKNIDNFIVKSKKNPQKLKVLEPSAGEGIFLKFLLQNKFSDIDAFEMDLSLKENLLELYPNVNFEFNNFLSSTLVDKYDLIIGNPPYLGQNYNAAIFQEYIRKYPICAKYFVGNMDLFYFFIHLGIEKLNPGGLLSYITTNYWITKSQKTGIKYLKPHILNECFLLQYIDLSTLNIFEDAKGQHNCIFVLQKKNNKEKIESINKDIQIIHILDGNQVNKDPNSFNKLIFENLSTNNHSRFIKTYTSSVTNNDLKLNTSWNLLYPKEIKVIVDKIEDYCKYNDRVLKLKDFFIIRNGLILINDTIFILKEGKELKVENNHYFINVNGKYAKLNPREINRLKKVYKSKSIVPYGYIDEDYLGYILYFNKNEFEKISIDERNRLLEEKYPSLTRYLEQFEDCLRETLINAKENPDDFYFPRRGSFIRQFNKKSQGSLVDLESCYDSGKKIFFKYISDKNIFGYTDGTYYATSDTYFFWPKPQRKDINYLFMLAYLNSSLVTFLYRAKNISIKRSKTKLEYGLPIPNLKNFISKGKISIIKLIELLTLAIINGLDSNLVKNFDIIYSELINFNWLNSNKNSLFKQNIKDILKNNNKLKIQKVIDGFLFQLFDLSEKKITRLLNEYYAYQLK